MQMTIFLIGFMGSGKTTFGKKLAAKLSLNSLDLDDEILLHTNTPNLKSLIEEKEIKFFREAESKVLKSLLLSNTVISTGGGTACYYDNITWMKKNGIVVFLKVDEGVLFSRLKNTDLEERPLLKNLNEDGLRSFITEKLEERIPFYSQAHIVFDPVNDKIENLIKSIQMFDTTTKSL
jgi:shikimate kinase